METEISQNCVIEKKLNAFPEDITKEEEDKRPNALNLVSLANGPRALSMSRVRLSIDGRQKY
jgi:hypothetical protein